MLNTFSGMWVYTSLINGPLLSFLHVIIVDQLKRTLPVYTKRMSGEQQRAFADNRTASFPGFFVTFTARVDSIILSCTVLKKEKLSGKVEAFLNDEVSNYF